MSRTSTSIALVTAAMCATVLVSNAGADTGAGAGAGSGAGTGGTTVTPTTTITPTLVTTTTTVTPTVTVTYTTPTETDEPDEPKTGTLDVLQAFSSGDFSQVSTPAIILFVLGIATGVLNLALQIDPEQVNAMIADARKQFPNLPF